MHSLQLLKQNLDQSVQAFNASPERPFYLDQTGVYVPSKGKKNESTILEHAIGCMKTILADYNLGMQSREYAIGEDQSELIEANKARLSFLVNYIHSISSFNPDTLSTDTLLNYRQAVMIGRMPAAVSQEGHGSYEILVDEGYRLDGTSLPQDPHQRAEIENVRSGVITLAHLCAAHNISYWLEGELLLGTHHNGDVLPYAPKGTFAFLDTDFDRVKSALKAIPSDGQNKYAVEDWSSRDPQTQEKGKNYLKLKITNLESRKSVYISLYFYHRDGDTLTWLDPNKGNSNGSPYFAVPLKGHLVFPLTEAIFQGTSVSVPAKTNDYLVFKYSDIRPKKSFDAERRIYLNTTGDMYVREQRSIIRTLPPLASDDTITFSGSHANIPVLHRPKKEKHEKWKDVIQQVHKLFEKLHIAYWVEAGTLLGVFRHGEIIPYDHDTDIATSQANFNAIYELFTLPDDALLSKYGIRREDYAILNKAKYKIEDWSSKVVDEVTGQKVSEKSYLRLKLIEAHTHLDIYMYQIDSDRKTVSWIDPHLRSHCYPKWHTTIPYDALFPLHKARFYDGEVRVVNKTEEYLQIRYGDLTPNKVWNASKGRYENVHGHEYNTGEHSAVSAKAAEISSDEQRGMRLVDPNNS